MTTLRFDTVPSVLKAYSSFISRRPGVSEGEQLPELRAELRPIALDRQQVREYQRVCGIPEQANYELPLLYPHVLAAPLHAQIMAHPEFPLQAAGLIHVRNTVTQHRPIQLFEMISIDVEIDGTRPANKGNEFDLITRVKVQGEVVWESVTTVLSPVRGKGATKKKKNRNTTSQSHNQPPIERSATVRVPADQGRQYARVSGDFNPIHMHAVSAKLFGFKRAIAHGMWTLARCLGEVHDDLPASPCFLEVDFKRPVLLPSSVLITSRRGGAELSVDVKQAHGSAPHLRCRVYGIDEGSTEEE